MNIILSNIIYVLLLLLSIFVIVAGLPIIKGSVLTTRIFYLVYMILYTYVHFMGYTLGYII
jgi:hypothetical protein